jgi:hypothetical protein
MNSKRRLVFVFAMLAMFTFVVFISESTMSLAAAGIEIAAMTLITSALRWFGLVGELADAVEQQAPWRRAFLTILLGPLLASEMMYRFINRRLIKQSSGPVERAVPPSTAEWILCLISKPKLRESTIGDFAEEFERNLIKYGLRRAKYIYWAMTLRSAWPLILQFGRRTVVRWIVKWGPLGIVAEFVRRHLY